MESNLRRPFFSLFLIVLFLILALSMIQTPGSQAAGLINNLLVGWLIVGVLILIGLNIYDRRTTRTRREVFAAAAAERGLTYTEGDAMGEVRRVTTRHLIRLFRLSGTTSGVPWVLEVTRTYRYIRRGSRNGRRRVYDPVFMHWATPDGHLAEGGVLFLPDEKAALQARTEGKTGFLTRLGTGLKTASIDAYETWMMQELSAGSWTVHPLVDPSLEQAYVAYASDGEALAYVLTREMTSMMEARKPNLNARTSPQQPADTSPDVSMPIFMISTRGTEVIWRASADVNRRMGYDTDAIFKVVTLGVQLAKFQRGF